MMAKGCTAAVCLWLAATALADENVRRVGSLGQPTRFEAQGAKTFSPAEIREELFNELEIIAACDSEAPLGALADLLAERTAAGYRSAGFPDVTVRAAAVEDRIRATIEEGERFVAGEVEVVGNRLVDAARLRTDLAPPAESNGLKPRRMWRVGEPAPFNAEASRGLALKIVALVEDQGFYRAQVNVSVVPDRQAKKAKLRIEFTDEGPRTTAGDVDFVGQKLNSSEALKMYLALEPQTPLTRELREQIERRLLRSGRFVSVRWKLGDLAERDAAWRPRLELVEYDLAPALAEPVSREEAALLKLAEWIERFEQSDEQLLINFDEEAVCVVFAPRRGFLVTAPSSASDATLPGAPNFTGALVMAEDTVGLYSVAQRRKLVAAPPPSPITGEAALTLIDGPPAWSGRGTVRLGAGLHTSAQCGYRRHVKMELKLAAAAALSLVRKHEAQHRWEGDVLILEWGNRRLRVDASTGRLLEHRAPAQAPAEGQTAEDQSSIQVIAKPGEFERRLAEIERLSADWPNTADAQRPLSCLSEFLCDEAWQFDPDWRRGYAALRKLLSLDVLAPFDELLRQACRPTTEGFAIPRPPWTTKFDSLYDLAAASPVFARAFGVRLGNYLLPRDGWPNHLWRDALLTLAHRPMQSPLPAGRAAEEQGPLYAWLTAELAQVANRSVPSAASARQGLRRLSLDAFESDCGDLVSGQGFVSQYLLRLAETLRQLGADEAEELSALLVGLDVFGAPQAAAFQQCTAALRSSSDETPAQAAAKALDALWRAGLSDLVERRLKALAGLPPQAPGIDANRAAPLKGRPRYTYPVTATPDADQEEAYSNAPPPPNQTLRREIAELTVAARLLAERLAALDEKLRLQSGEQSDASGAAQPPSAAAPAAPPSKPADEKGLEDGLPRPSSEGTGGPRKAMLHPR